MTQINLLPWREQERKEKTKNFGLLLFAFAIAGVLIVLMQHLYLDHLITLQQERTDFLDSQLALEKQQLGKLLEEKTDQESIDVKLHAIMNLQENSFQVIEILNELVRIVPKGIVFTKLVREGDKLTIYGLTPSNSAVTTLMDNLEKSPAFMHPKLTEIKSDASSGNIRSFQIYAQFQRD